MKIDDEYIFDPYWLIFKTKLGSQIMFGIGFGDLEMYAVLPQYFYSKLQAKKFLKKGD